MALFDVDQEIIEMHRRMCRLIEQQSRHKMGSCFSGVPVWRPALDVVETGESYHVLVDLAGVDLASLEVTIEGNMLYLRGERPRPQMPSCTTVQQLEIDFGAFERSFQFASGLDSEGAHSTYKNGLLEIIVPKQQARATIRVQVQDDGTDA